MLIGWFVCIHGLSSNQSLVNTFGSCAECQCWFSNPTPRVQFIQPFDGAGNLTGMSWEHKSFTQRSSGSITTMFTRFGGGTHKWTGNLFWHWSFQQNSFPSFGFPFFLVKQVLPCHKHLASDEAVRDRVARAIVTESPTSC